MRKRSWLRAINVAVVIAMAAMLFGPAQVALAAVTVTPASGGGAISADTAGVSWTPLGTIRIIEANKGDIVGPVAQDITLVLKAPSGFEFDTGVTPDTAFTAAADITAVSVSMTDAETMTVTMTHDTSANKIDTIDIGVATFIQVRPTAGNPLASGQIYRPTTGGGTATITGITTTDNADGSGATNFGTLTEVAGAVPTFSSAATNAAGSIISVT
ncbi:hypothetical protein ACFLUO_10095, partial [Chloroflexota bacterium]